MATIKITVPRVVLECDRKDIRRVLRQAGEQVAQAARALIENSTGGAGSPPRNRTGTLENSIKPRVNTAANAVSITATGRSDGFYALPLEAGRRQSTRQGGIHKKQKGKDRLGRLTNTMEPHPFLSTAIEQLPGDFGEKLARAVIEGISLKKL